MPRPSSISRRPAGPLWRLLTLCVAVSQLLVVGAAWLDSAAGGRDQRTHVEAAGTRLHYVHDDSTCELCALQHMSGAPFAVRDGGDDPVMSARVPTAPADRRTPDARVSTTRSRAPPAGV